VQTQNSADKQFFDSSEFGLALANARDVKKVSSLVGRESRNEKFNLL
jgi:hypothetical protein